MEDELDTIISSFVFTLMAIKGLKPVADKVGLLDVPNHRKQHKGAVPLIGGVSIFIGVAISALLFMSLDAQQKVLLAASLVIVVMGVFDDLYDLSVRLRLGIQAICTLILCFSLHVSLAHLGYMLGFFSLNIGVAGYVLAKKRFPGRAALFSLLVGAMALPKQVILIPLLREMSSLQLYNTIWAVIFPIVGWPFGVFLMKQFSEGIPGEMLEAARIDGASEAKTFVRIALPMIKPGIGALAIFTFINSWNDYFMQLIMLSSTSKLTISLGIAKLQAENSTDYGLIMAGAALAAVRAQEGAAEQILRIAIGEIEHRHDGTSQIDDTADMLGCQRNLGNAVELDDFLDLSDRQRKSFSSGFKGQPRQREVGRVRIASGCGQACHRNSSPTSSRSSGWTSRRRSSAGSRTAAESSLTTSWTIWRPLSAPPSTTCSGKNEKTARQRRRAAFLWKNAGKC